MWRLVNQQTTIAVPPTGAHEVGRSVLGEKVAKADALNVSRVQCIVTAEVDALVIRAAGTNPCMWRHDTGGAWTLLAKPHECRLADGDLVALDMKQKYGTVFVVRQGTPVEPLAPQSAAMGSPPPQPASAVLQLPQPAAELTRREGGCGCAGHPHCCALCCGICYVVRGGSDSDEEDGRNGQSKRKRKTKEAPVHRFPTTAHGAIRSSLCLAYPLESAEPVRNQVAAQLRLLEKFEIALQGDDYADKEHADTNHEALTYARAAAAVLACGF